MAGVENLAPGAWTRWSADGARVRRPLRTWRRHRAARDSIGASRASRRGGAAQPRGAPRRGRAGRASSCPAASTRPRFSRLRWMPARLNTCTVRF